jgi:DNA-binding response OmpR family regulator
MAGEAILIIEDDSTLLRGLKDNFQSRGYRVRTAADGEAGLDAALANPPDLILLDIMLPKINGYEICRTIRERELEMPIIMLTAKGQEEDIILGLNLGADDYVTKPFRIRELLARVSAFLRRRQTKDSEVYWFGDCQLDLAAHKLFRRGAEVALTAKEFRMLEYFVKRRGRALARNDIMSSVWGSSVMVTSRSVDRCVTTLRSKIEPDPRNPTYIQTIRDIGYRFEVPEDQAATDPKAEIETAQQVQRRLLPQRRPPLETLDYAGHCIPALVIGGDYYDYLDLGDGRVGLLLADISGKGISAALLMANLQACFRSQNVMAGKNAQALLESINALLYESSEPQRYATLFFGIYDDATRRLTYANCGHNPPLLLRPGRQAQRLEATATVIGLFTDWECATQDVTLAPDDTLAVFTDGITEAVNRAGEPFGDHRLLGVLEASHDLPASQVVEIILSRVREFSHGQQQDDMTLLVARARGATA